jgi:hypothetical protein
MVPLREMGALISELQAIDRVAKRRQAAAKLP